MSKQTVLLVDNNERFRGTVQEFLEMEGKTVNELSPQREAVSWRAAQLHTFGLVAKSIALVLLTTAIVLLLLGLTNAGTVAAISGSLAECFDLLCNKQEKQAYKRALELNKELHQIRQGDHWLLMCEAFEDAETRDEYRRKMLEHILLQRSG